MASHGDDRTEALASRLVPALADALDDDSLVVDGLQRLSGGASRETWSLVARGPLIGERHLILQRLRPGGAAGGPSMEVEDRLLAAARAAGVPVPDTVVDAASAESAGLGPARVAEHVRGEALGPRLVRAERSDGERRALARQLGAALAGIHHVDPATVPELEAVDPLARVRDGLDLLGEHRPALEVGLRRLGATRPEPGPEAVVHGDFRVGNLLIDDGRLTAVLDWELAHRGDPVEDLGWICGRAWRFGGDREVGGLADLDDLLAGYTEAGGRPVSVEAVRWWTAAGTLLWGLICAVQARRHLDGLVRSVELATIGRRVCEAEYDLLDLVLDPVPADVSRADATSHATDRPREGRAQEDAAGGPARGDQPPVDGMAEPGSDSTAGRPDDGHASGGAIVGPAPGSDSPIDGTAEPGGAPGDEAPDASRTIGSEDTLGTWAPTPEPADLTHSAPGPASAETGESSQHGPTASGRSQEAEERTKSPSPTPTAGAAGLHGRPTAAELVEAVRGHLAEEVAPGLEGSARFHARVAAHALEVVGRELRLGPNQQDAHAARLASLGFADDVALARAIRSGDLDDRSDVEAAVRASVVDRLRVANPRWLHPPDA